MMNISNEMIDQIRKQAEAEYPHECCGMILGPKDQQGQLSRLRACKNVYDKFHEADPDNFPRTSATAYFIDPRELLLIQKELREANEELRIIYHSHINAGAYFSEEDQRVAASEGEPAYPGVNYLVVSVVKGKVKESNIFRWSEKEKKYIL